MLPSIPTAAGLPPAGLGVLARRALSALLPLLLPALLLAGLAGPAHAGALGEPWEELIEEGVRRQDTKLRDDSLDALVREAQNLADRPATGDARVARLYLLARAHGKRLAPGSRDLDEARANYAEVLRLQPRCYFAHRDLAMLALRSTPPDTRTAEAGLQRALAIYPSFVQALRDLAVLCQQQGRLADALVHVRRVIDLEPGDLPARGLLAVALLELGRVAEAQREVDALVKAYPAVPRFRDLEARVALKQGDFDRAIALWKVMRKQFPSDTAPLSGLWQAYLAKEKAGQPVPKDELVRVLDGLTLLTRDAEARKKLAEARTALLAPPPDPTKPPDDATLSRALEAPEEKMRAEALKYVAFRNERPSLPLMRAVMSRLGAAREPAAAVRAAVLLVLAQHGGPGQVPFARLALADSDARVRLATVVALDAMGTQSVAAGRAVVLILGRLAADPDPEVAAASRATVLRLSGLTLEAPPEEGESEEQAAARWTAWWKGPQGTDLRIRALADYAEVRDHYAEQVLEPYLADPDLFVFKAAYEALAQMSAYLPDPARRAWAGGIPRFLPDEWRPENRAALEASIANWLRTRPQ